MNKVENLVVSVLGERNQPLKTVRVTTEQGELQLLNPLEPLFAAARKLNPELGMEGLIRGIIRIGVQDVVKQIKAGKLDAFLKERRS